jgi:hypothetical protein
LSLDGGDHRIARALKDEEKTVAFTLEFDAAAVGDGPSEYLAMRLEDTLGLHIAHLLQQASRSLDISEQEGNGPGRQIGHRALA